MSDRYPLQEAYARRLISHLQDYVKELYDTTDLPTELIVGTVQRYIDFLCHLNEGPTKATIKVDESDPTKLVITLAGKL